MEGAGASDELEPGRIVAGRYRVVRTLGRGGFGAVYEAEHVTLKKVVALKVLLPTLSGNAEVVQRFMREAQSAAAIGHPGIVEVFDLGSDAGLAFLAMEKLEGEELFERIQRDHPLDPKLVARIGMDIADAIAAAHENGIIHRDLKPQNVFLARRGRRTDIVKVLDFGIAKLAEADRADAPLTKTGQVFGTPLYMSPEQLRAAKDLDGRADVYAMGAILYESLAGHPPFTAESYSELVLKVATEQPPRLGTLRDDLPAALIDIVERAMHKDREQRIESAQALADALDAFLGGRTTAATEGVATGAPRASQPNPFAETMQSGDHGSASKSVPLTETPFATSSLLPPAPGRSRSVQWLAGVVVLLVAGGAATAWMLGRDHGAEDPALASTAAGLEAVSALDTEAEHAGEPTPEPPRTAPDAGAALPSTRIVRFETAPPGAAVRVGDRVLCETPCEAELEDVDTTVELRRSGYRAEERTMASPLPRSLVVSLTRRLPGRPGPRVPSMSDDTVEPAPPPLRER